VGGLAFATALASTVNATVLTRSLRKRIGLIGGRRILKTCLQSSAASVIMAGAAWSLVHYAPGPAVIRVPSAILLGTAIYAVLARLWGMEELTHVMAVVRRPKKEAEGDLTE